MWKQQQEMAIHTGDLAACSPHPDGGVAIPLILSFGFNLHLYSDPGEHAAMSLRQAFGQEQVRKHRHGGLLRDGAAPRWRRNSTTVVKDVGESLQDMKDPSRRKTSRPDPLVDSFSKMADEQAKDRVLRREEMELQQVQLEEQRQEQGAEGGGGPQYYATSSFDSYQYTGATPPSNPFPSTEQQ